MSNNTGKDNTGDGNSGDGNSGYRNSGYRNSGYRNSGYWNSGDGNSGNGNSGDRNSGDRNSGDGNSGNWNSGYWNSGNRNSGYWNSGDGNSGYGNSCHRSSGIFCTETPKLYCFNAPTDKGWEEIAHPDFNGFRLTKWIPDTEMSSEEKVAEPEFHVRGGYLKKYTWEEAWKNYWRDSDEEEKQRVLNLPNFDAEIFKEITGIDVESKPSCNGKIVEIEGKRYRLEEV